MQFMQPKRKSKAKIVVAVVIVVLVIGAVGAYLLVLAPRMSIVNSTHTTTPWPETLEQWQYNFSVTVKNSGVLSGKMIIVCDFSYVNGTNATKTFTGSMVVSLGGGQHEEYTVKVMLPWNDAAASILAQNKSWEAKLT